MFAWPLYTLRDGKLYDERGRRCFLKAPYFNTITEAEKWLKENDLRGNVR